MSLAHRVELIRLSHLLKSCKKRNLADSFLTLFYVVSFDGWVDNMFNGMGTVTVDETMERDYSEALTMPHLDSCSEKFLSSEMLCAESAVGVR